MLVFYLFIFVSIFYFYFYFFYLRVYLYLDLVFDLFVIMFDCLCLLDELRGYDYYYYYYRYILQVVSFKYLLPLCFDIKKLSQDYVSLTFFSLSTEE